MASAIQYGHMEAMSSIRWRMVGLVYELFICICGKEFTAFLNNIIRGHTKSCGCIKAKWAKENRATHGLLRGGHTPEFETWSHLRSRCYNPKNKKYPDYGGRGISVCDRWRFSFENFIIDMGLKPENKYTIERIDNDGDYEPLNCKWASPKEQARNKRNTIIVFYNGVAKPLIEWCEKLGLKYDNIRARKNQKKISAQEAFNIYAPKNNFISHAFGYIK